MNKDSTEYCQTDNNTLSVDWSETIGCLIRGTDYIKLKPHGHPVQPEPSVIFAELKNELINRPTIKNIYLATEEKRLFNLLVDAFPNYKIITNRRMYFDDQFYSEKKYQIADVKFNRENDHYLRGIEYLSSLILLSKCSGIVAASSGGTLGSCYLRSSFENCRILQYGFYK